MASKSQKKEKSILDRKYSVEKKEREDSFPDEDDRGVTIRLPRGSTEIARVAETTPYLAQDLSSLVNEYESREFEGELKHIIKSTPDSYIATALFLDNDRLAVLVVVDDIKKDYYNIDSPDNPKSIYLDIYNPVNWEKIVHKKINMLPEYSFREIAMVITPMRNLLITFHTDVECRLYYLDQDGEKIWSKIYKELYFKNGDRAISVLNDDTIIIRNKYHLIIIPNEKSDGYIPAFEAPPFRYAIEIYSKKMTIIPYKAKGFIAYNYKEIYLRNEGEERILIKATAEQGTITAVKLLNEQVLLYATSDGYLRVFDIKEGREINRNRIGKKGTYVGKIDLLAHNRCLLLCGKTPDLLDKARIYDLADLEYVERQYRFYNTPNYLGSFSNSNVPLFSRHYDTVLLVYNILKREGSTFTFSKLKNSYYVKLLSVSSLDLLAILKEDGEGHYYNKLYIFG